MLYKTIVLEFLQDQYPQLSERLRAQRMLLATVNLQAAALKRYHETWMDRLALVKPGDDESLIASEALALAVEDLRGNFGSEPENGEDAETSTLGGAMMLHSYPMPTE
jgi:hypothetical protein